MTEKREQIKLSLENLVQTMSHVNQHIEKDTHIRFSGRKWSSEQNLSMGWSQQQANQSVLHEGAQGI